jgi:hypothetical protein
MHNFVLQPFFEVRLGLHQNCSIIMLLPMAFTFRSLPVESWRSLQLICKLYFIWLLKKYLTYNHNWRSIVLEFPSSYCVRTVCWASCYVTFMWHLLLYGALIRKKTLWWESLPVCVCYGFWTAAEVFLWYGELWIFIKLSLNFVGEIWKLPFKWTESMDVCSAVKTREENT